MAQSEEVEKGAMSWLVGGSEKQRPAGWWGTPQPGHSKVTLKGSPSTEKHARTPQIKGVYGSRVVCPTIVALSQVQSIELIREFQNPKGNPRESYRNHINRYFNYRPPSAGIDIESPKISLPHCLPPSSSLSLSYDNYALVIYSDGLDVRGSICEPTGGKFRPDIHVCCIPGLNHTRVWVFSSVRGHLCSRKTKVLRRRTKPACTAVGSALWRK